MNPETQQKAAFLSSDSIYATFKIKVLEENRVLQIALLDPPINHFAKFNPATAFLPVFHPLWYVILRQLRICTRYLLASFTEKWSGLKVNL